MPKLTASMRQSKSQFVCEMLGQPRWPGGKGRAFKLEWEIHKIMYIFLFILYNLVVIC
jgi:hypothetical protein